ncbi:peroxisomal acyl-coenzyme A oxidase 1-like [Centruroides sculpturatus]|uniref:peroxisomal acyl-coenzyme A oxidase 1-like n=1 Tax=Centruroides sculpturatus TaxID=218467 RepID=UPI000C6CEEE0|nr:peroxisomal acyl-coenzyme A oxidase 1-like [Centruroides sculpturatus]
MLNEVNEDLVKERKNASFNIKDLTYLLDGSEEKTLRRRELEKEYYTDPELKDDYPIDYQSHSEVYDSALQKSLHFFHKAMEMADPQEMLLVADAFLHEASPAAVHFIMFIPALMGLATEEQQNKWLPEALEMKIIGSYAQTELGHGTFLRGLQTTATYDPKTQEFILNTPTLSSIKWWPGSLGKTANHAIVLAQLYIKGKCYGIHPFMVQIRNMEDHQPLPGITVGEIGPKMGMRASDNGFLKLDNVRIPYENMFMKNAQVTRDGEYIKPKSDKLNYGTMVFVRVLITDMVAFNLARACTIATRYSAVRRQSEIIAGKGEVQILDYQAQQYKLLPLIALTHAIKATFLSLMQTYKVASQNLEKGDLGNLPELHAISSGLKALCSDKGSRGIETCRLACGGHGYLLISGLPRLYSLTVAACTYEGENTVLYLQTARFLLKCLKQGNLSPDSNFNYLLKKGGGIVTPLSAEPTLKELLSLYEAVAYR